MQASRHQDFRQRVANALEEPDRILSIDNAVEAAAKKRRRAFEALPNDEEIRDKAREIRAHTIANLDQYLVEFEERATANGFKIHWARNAREARQHVIRIVSDNQAKSVVKSKSMLSEEIGLNEALEEARVDVVETDLGEYIAQLADDRPSHIITPIIHLNRQDVAGIFREKLGASGSDDISYLNTVARDALQDKFLNADVGITGCNFGVAEAGALCLVENEGNVRMVSSVPDVHIALMGIERLVPSFQELSVMLQLLARSATGQKLTAYTTIIHGARCTGEPSGPRESHVVLIDNGRTRALAGDLAEILYCIRCGACLNICPVYRAIGGHAYGSTYSGPVGAVISPILGGTPTFPDLPHASTLCGACEEVCPVRIQLPTLLLRLRRNTVQEGQSPAWMKIVMSAYAAVTRSAQAMNLAEKAASLICHLLGADWYGGQLPGPLRSWTTSREFPLFNARPFRQRWGDLENNEG
jgi:L-lactate dehydrogenase complex protein LldF